MAPVVAVPTRSAPVRWLVAVVVLVLSVAAACGDDDEGADSAYCEDARAVAELPDPFAAAGEDAVDPMAPDELREALESRREAVEQAADRAPEELEDDWQVVRITFDRIFAILEEADFDPEQWVERQEEIQALTQNNVLFAQAAIDIGAYDQRVCGVEPTTTTTEPLGPVEARVEQLEQTLSAKELARALELTDSAGVLELATAIEANRVDLDELERQLEEPIEGQPFAQGDDAALDALAQRCEAEGGAPCDELAETAPLNSEYERIGLTCAGTRAESVEPCVAPTDTTAAATTEAEGAS
jgi:hypothetical protein